jgi:hypothetical protein
MTSQSLWLVNPCDGDATVITYHLSLVEENEQPPARNARGSTASEFGAPAGRLPRGVSSPSVLSRMIGRRAAAAALVDEVAELLEVLLRGAVVPDL